ncbi:general transcription factor 3C polypeptide 6-like [Dysidea avara]|uniref:general transcription factor 3C polypeptide 6-like n=1 Tax=Dysidea avara TaxID=196820 RepID=UPI003325D1A9
MSEEVEEEEQLVFVEFQGLPDPTILRQKGSCTMLGIDTTEPFLQIDRCFFRGKYEDAIGTYLLFKQGTEHDQVMYLCKTTKRMIAEQVSIRKKHQNEGDEQELEASQQLTGTLHEEVEEDCVTLNDKS